MRRQEKEVKDNEDIEQIFKEAYVCRLGLFDGRIPYIVPMNFGYRNDVLYFHSSLSGRKIDILKKNPIVCFEIDAHGDVKSSDTACSWSMSYRSVMGEGQVSFIYDEKEKVDALNVIMEHYSDRANWDFNSKMMGKTLIFKVEIESVSGKESGE